QMQRRGRLQQGMARPFRSAAPEVHSIPPLPHDVADSSKFPLVAAGPGRQNPRRSSPPLPAAKMRGGPIISPLSCVRPAPVPRSGAIRELHLSAKHPLELEPVTGRNVPRDWPAAGLNPYSAPTLLA